MNKDFLFLLMGCFMLSLIIAHMMWVRIRVWRLRQDLFEIRDCLWEQMRSKNDLDNTSHRRIRDIINSNIRYAHKFSLWTLSIALFHGVHEADLNIDQAPPEVKTAVNKMSDCMMNYLMFQTLTGIICITFAILLMTKRKVQDKLSIFINRLTLSEEMENQKLATS